MLELVLANLKTRPFRTLISIVGVALGVVLILLFTGLARGMSENMVKRAANWKAEIIFTRPGAFGTDEFKRFGFNYLREPSVGNRRRAGDRSRHSLHHAGQNRTLGNSAARRRGMEFVRRR